MKKATLIIISLIFIIIIFAIFYFIIFRTSKQPASPSPTNLTAQTNNFSSWQFTGNDTKFGSFSKDGRKFRYYDVSSKKLNSYSLDEKQVIWSSDVLSNINIDEVSWSSSGDEAVIGHSEASSIGENSPKYQIVNSDGKLGVQLSKNITKALWIDQDKLLAIYYDKNSQSSNISIINKNNLGEFTSIYSIAGYATDFYPSPDQQYGIIISQFETETPFVKLIDLSGKKELKALDTKYTSIKWASDSKYFAAISEDKDFFGDLYAVGGEQLNSKFTTDSLEKIFVSGDSIYTALPMTLSESDQAIDYINKIDIKSAKVTQVKLPYGNFDIQALTILGKIIFFKSNNYIYSITL